MYTDTIVYIYIEIEISICMYIYIHTYTTYIGVDIYRSLLSQGTLQQLPTPFPEAQATCRSLIP